MRKDRSPTELTVDECLEMAREALAFADMLDRQKRNPEVARDLRKTAEIWRRRAKNGGVAEGVFVL